MQEESEDIKEIIKEDVWGSIKGFLDLGFHIGEGEKSIHLTIGLLLLLTITLVATKFILKWSRHILTRKMQQEDKQKFTSVFKFLNYVIYLIAVLVTLSAAGVDITLVITASAALFVGLGLALQELFKDVLGGIFIIVDKSLQVGDVVEVDGKVGKVFEIKLRTTRALTRDDKVLILPNHKFISDIVYNYTQNHRTTREKVSVGVAYGSDVDLVVEILKESASEHSEIKNKSSINARFLDFGNSSLDFELLFFSKDIFRIENVKSEIRKIINRKFIENNITIPFPQIDLHLKSNNTEILTK